MSSNERIFIIDDSEDRCEKLRTIFDFIGQSIEVTKFASWQIITHSNPSVIIVGAHSSFEKTLDELDSLVKQFSKVPILVIYEQLNTTQCAEHNVVACLSFPFSYAQMLESLHR